MTRFFSLSLILFLLSYVYFGFQFSKMRQHFRCNLLFGLIGHFGLLKYGNLVLQQFYFILFSKEVYLRASEREMELLFIVTLRTWCKMWQLLLSLYLIILTKYFCKYFRSWASCGNFSFLWRNLLWAWGYKLYRVTFYISFSDMYLNIIIIQSFFWKFP